MTGRLTIYKGCNLYEFIYAIKIPHPLTNGNTGRGNHWYASATERKKFEWMLSQFATLDPESCCDYLNDFPFDFPVGLRVTRVLGKKQRLWDVDSIGRGNAKELIDALVGIGILEDDGPAFVKHVEWHQLSLEKRPKYPCIIVEFFKYADKN